MLVVDVVDHAVRIREVLRIEIMRTPGVFRPVRPVQHDGVDRQLALAVLVQRAGQFGLGLVALAALPETVRPLRQQHGLAGQRAVAGQHLVGVVAGDHIVVDRLCGLGPDRQVPRFVGGQRIAMQQRDVRRLDAVPHQLHLVALAGLHLQRELVVPRVPVLAPAVQHQLAVDVELGILAVVQREGMPPVAARGDLAFPHHVAAAALGQVLARGREVRQVLDVLVVHFAFATLDHLPAVDGVARGQRARPALGVEQVQRRAQRLQAARIAVAGDRVAVPQDAVVARGDEIGNRLVDVVLEQFDIAALEVHPALLVQAGAVEGLVFRRFETLADGVVVLALDPGRREGACALGQQRLAGGIEEADPARAGIDLCRDALRADRHLPAGFAHLHRRRCAGLRAHQAGRAGEIAVGIGHHAQDARRDRLDLDVGGGRIGGTHDHTVIDLLDDLLACGVGARCGQGQQRHRQRLQVTHRLLLVRARGHPGSGTGMPARGSISRWPASPAATAGCRRN